jgi:ribonuclease E
VKSITPSQPAPVSARSRAQNGTQKSLWSTIMGWFSSGDESSSASGSTRSRGDRNDRNDRNNRDRNNRSGRGGRPQDQSRDRNEPRQGQNQKGRGKEREAREPLAEGASAGQSSQAREPRAKNDRQQDRKPRQERGDRSAERQPAESVLNGTPAVSGAEIVAGGEAGENRGGRGRRRRGRGGRREEGDHSNGNGNSNGAAEEFGPPDTPAQQEVSAAAPVYEPVAQTAATPAYEPVADKAAPTPAPAYEPVAAAPTPSPTPMATPAPVPAPAPAAIKISEEDLKASLNQVGLQWVQTDPGKAVQAAEPEPAPKLGRAPRVQSTESAPAEPLVMVETRSNNP